MPRIVNSWFPGDSLQHLLYPEGPIDAWTLEQYEAHIVLPPFSTTNEGIVQITARDFGIPTRFHQRLIRLRVQPWFVNDEPRSVGYVACLHVNLLEGVLAPCEAFRFSSFTVLPRVLYLRSSWFALPAAPETVVARVALTRRPPSFPAGLRVVLEVQKHMYGMPEPLRVVIPVEGEQVVPNNNTQPEAA